MSMLFDLILLVLLGVNVYVGYRKGLIRSLFHTFSIVASLVIAYLLSTSVGSYLQSLFLHGAVKGRVDGALSTLVDEGTKSADMAQLLDKMPSSFQKTLSTLDIDPEQLADRFAGDAASGSATLYEDVVEYISSPISQTIGRVLAFVLIFVLALVALSLACMVLNTIFRLPVLNKLNKTLGLAFGALTGLLLVCAVSSLLVGLVSVLEDLELVGADVIEKTVLVKAFAKLNLISSLW